MNELPFIETTEIFKQEVQRLRALRKNGKLKTKRLYRFTKEDRKIIHAKTGGKCHICGQEVLVDKFEADHVKSHSTGGTSIIDNFLPACKTCNNYRWHYLPEELQWILKLGVWAGKLCHYLLLRTPVLKAYSSRQLMLVSSFPIGS